MQVLDNSELFSNMCVRYEASILEWLTIGELLKLVRIVGLKLEKTYLTGFMIVQNAIISVTVMWPAHKKFVTEESKKLLEVLRGKETVCPGGQ